MDMNLILILVSECFIFRVSSATRMLTFWRCIFVPSKLTAAKAEERLRTRARQNAKRFRFFHPWHFFPFRLFQAILPDSSYSDSSDFWIKLTKVLLSISSQTFDSWFFLQQLLVKLTFFRIFQSAKTIYFSPVHTVSLQLLMFLTDRGETIRRRCVYWYSFSFFSASLCQKRAEISETFFWTFGFFWYLKQNFCLLLLVALSIVPTMEVKINLIKWICLRSPTSKCLAKDDTLFAKNHFLIVFSEKKIVLCWFLGFPDSR